ncbi:MAG: helix-turn-helix domain-containing protein, partial [Flavobacteriia bacterium]
MPTLNQLIAEGEHLHQDFKFRIDDQRKIARTLCAFANTEGGRLLIGVKDNRKVVGCDPAEEFHMIEGAAKMFCQPEVKFSSKIWQEDFRLVLQIDVWASDTKPHRAQDDDGR